MKSFVFAILVLGFLLMPAMAQEEPATPSADESTIALSKSTIEPTSEMWFYEQERRDRLDPALAVRRNAEARAAQRRLRIAAMKWFGYSNLRPKASPDPINGNYSPFWAGNNRLAPFMWSGNGYPTVIVRPGRVQYR